MKSVHHESGADIAVESARFKLLFHSLLILVVLAFVVFVRVRLFDVPLERDEGEYAYMGQLLLKGIPPYVHAYTMKLPGVSMIYALFMTLFGQTPFGIHLGLLIVNLLSASLLFLLARRLIDGETATYSTIVYLVLSLSQGVLGIFAHATHFVNLFSLAGFLLLFHYSANRRLLLIAASGACFGMAIAMKQHAIVPALFALTVIVMISLNKRIKVTSIVSASCLFILGATVPLAGIVLWLLQTGNLSQFWFWTVEYPGDYISSKTLSEGLAIFTYKIARITSFNLPLWIFSCAGVVFLLKRENRTINRKFILGYLLSSFLAVCPGFYFRNHYFIVILPSIALLAGLAIRESGKTGRSLRLHHLIPVILLATLVSYSFYNERAYCFTLSPVEVGRAVYTINPFPESLEIARYLKSHTSPKDRIAVLGSEPQIYFYADRLSATGHIYMYGLTEDHPNAEKMQTGMINEIEATRPLYIVKVSIWTSGPFAGKSPANLIKWADGYINANYQLVGIADIHRDRTDYIWDDQVKGYLPESDSLIFVYKRKGEMK